MALREWSKEIKGADDVELGIARMSPLVYHCTAPDIERATGFVFIIPGFGEDAAGSYQQSLRAYLAEKYSLLTVTVEYHCSQSRLGNGAVFSLSADEYDGLYKLCDRHHIQIKSPTSIWQALSQLNVPYELDFHISPGNGDYQNFGVMQALDHLLVLQDIHKDASATFEDSNVIAFGSSHGGYIAHLIAKFAPNTIHAVIDNSSYMGADFLHLAAPYYIGGMKIICHLVTHWELKDNASPFYFSPDCRAIRDTASPSHIGTMRQAAQYPCQYRMAHSVFDDLEPIAKKREQAQCLKAAGFNVVLREFGEGDIDGEMIKSLGHGMDASLRALFDYFYPTILPFPERKIDSELASSVAYLCNNLIFAFEHGNFGCSLNVSRLPKMQAGYSPTPKPR